MHLLLIPGLLLSVAACATTTAPDPVAHPAPAVTRARPAVAAPAYPNPRSAVSPAPAPRTAASHVPAPRAAVSPVPVARIVTPAVAPGGYVRLRGSPEIHLRSCAKVARASPGGVVPAKANDGPPCSLCRKAEALSRLR
ncbi:MAG: hypothetical protein MUE73_14110 [Planctomycetes bacterium]|nr:hypothetical protein [Planctomycetota bacterium]